MDLILKFVDESFLTPYVYPKENWPEESPLRQFISLFFILLTGGYLLYLSAAGLSFIIVFDKRLMKHPKFLKNQVSREIKTALTSIIFMSALQVLCFLPEVRGHSKLYNSIDESSLGWMSIPLTIVSFVLFTDCLIYWIHRGLHSSWAYKRLHKVHHYWKVPTPFASHAFHPVDGFLQSFPYHIYVFLFPMHKMVYLTMFVLVNFWTVSIHDGDFRVPKILTYVVNGAAHHTDHHLFYNYNYGQFFTLWDRVGGSFREPSSFMNDSPLDQILKNESSTKNVLKNGKISSDKIRSRRI